MITACRVDWSRESRKLIKRAEFSGQPETVQTVQRVADFLVSVNELTLQAGLPTGKDARSHRTTARVGGVEVVNCVDEIRVRSA